MKNAKPLVFALGVFALVSCGGASSSNKLKEESASPVSEDAFFSAISSLPSHSYASANMTASRSLSKNYQAYIDEQNRTCAYTYDASAKRWNASDNKLGDYTGEWVDAPNLMTISDAAMTVDSFLEGLELKYPVVEYYIESGFAIKITGQCPIEKLDPDIYDQFLNFSLTLAFDSHGLITAYESLNEGHFELAGDRYIYNDHGSFRIAYQ